MIKAAVPEASGKVKRIMEFAGGEGDVADPYGGTLEDYSRAFAEIRKAVENLVEQLKQDKF
jgi:protein-tyrosine phosphatase